MYDLSAQDAQTAARRMRMNARQQKESPEVLTEMVKIVGGRLTYLGKATKAPNMVEYAKHMLAVEKAWLLSQIGLIPDCDDDVMDEQKWSSCSWLLLREFVHRHEKEVERIREAVERGEAKAEELEGIPLPRIPYVRCTLFANFVRPTHMLAVRMPADHDAAGLHGWCVPACAC